MRRYTAITSGSTVRICKRSKDYYTGKDAEDKVMLHEWGGTREGSAFESSGHPHSPLPWTQVKLVFWYSFMAYVFPLLTPRYATITCGTSSRICTLPLHSRG
ncbi:hypothetical protein FOZ60_014162 [Perkinsus olseni]|uniref:Uncharacterized protein n=1 Tax=Perkinsus olseni TaxID=32597 RepID=A0A7J6N987_PEROL|nr:hypothetical protein FOZ60_014162 [Perkinsus olseni]